MPPVVGFSGGFSTFGVLIGSGFDSLYISYCSGSELLVMIYVFM